MTTYLTTLLGFFNCLEFFAHSNVVKTTYHDPIFKFTALVTSPALYEILNTLGFCLFLCKRKFSSSICHI